MFASRGAAAARSRPVAVALIVALTALSLWTYATATGTYDTWRDLWFAERLVFHNEWPWQGPVIGNVLHLGPLWFYLLAPAYALGGPVGAALFVALIAAAKYPLGFMLGRRFGGDALGLAFVVALALPGWGMLEPLMLTHTAIAQTSVLALALCAMALRERATIARAIAYGAVATLALHAHPTTVTFVIALGVFWWSAVRPWRRAFTCAAAALVVPVLSILPLLWHAWSFGADDAISLQVYADETLGAPVLSRVVPLITGIVWHGVRYAVDVWLDVPRWLALALAASHALVLSIAAIGIAVAWRAGAARAVVESDVAARANPSRRWLIAAVVAFLAHALVLLWLRPFTPVWMVWPVLPALAFAIAFGLASAWRWPMVRPLIVTVCAIGIATQVAATLRFNRLDDTVRFATRGGNLMDIADAPATEFSTITMPRASLAEAWRAGTPPIAPDSASPADGATCAPVAFYGHYAAVLEGSFWLGLLHRCGDASHARLGGPPNVGRAIVFGLGTDATRASVCVAPRHEGRLALLDVTSIWTRADAWQAIEPNRYPPRDVADVRQEFVVEGTASPDDIVVVSARVPLTRYVTMRDAQVDGRPIAPRYVDSVTAVYRCDDCAEGARWRLTMEGSPRDTDVFSARCAAR